MRYTYDSLARLTKAETLGPDWGQSFGYDGWGNLLSKGVTKGSAPVMSVTADPASNRLVVSGMTYDAKGNVTNMPGVGALAYDSRNRIVGTGGVPTRGYDPGNRKIWWKSSSGSTYVDFWLPNGEKLATFLLEETPVYDVNNTYFLGYVQLRATQRELYFAGRRVATQWGNTNSFTWLQPDRLSSNARHHPYGEERGTSSTEYKFATYQREASGLDYALNRYYSSVYGRFLSSDPYRASGGPSDPGSWNRYAYVLGDPANSVDPEGLLTILIPGTFNAEEPDWAQPGSSFNSAVSNAFDEQATLFSWSGDNSDLARQYAAHVLVDFVNVRIKPGECLNIVACSHGGNIAKIYSNLTGMKTICTLVTLGTPQSNQYQINRGRVPGSSYASAVGAYFNVSSYADPIQLFGGSPRRSDPCADNFYISQTPTLGLVGHSDLHTAEVWQAFEYLLKLGDYSSSPPGHWWQMGLRNSQSAYTCGGRYSYQFTDYDTKWPEPGY